MESSTTYRIDHFYDYGSHGTMPSFWRIYGYRDTLKDAEGLVASLIASNRLAVKYRIIEQVTTNAVIKEYGE